jgi:hypothetical protein
MPLEKLLHINAAAQQRALMNLSVFLQLTDHAACWRLGK